MDIIASGKAEITAIWDENAERGKVPVFFSEQKLFIIEWTLDDGTKGTNHYVAGYPKFDFEKIKNVWVPKIKETIK